MNIWLTKNSEVPIREQLALQVILGIAGGDLAAGDRLPSTGEISRRFGVHSNTVSAVYRELVGRKMLEFRKGSGYYVCDAAEEIAGRETKAARLIAEVFAELRSLGFNDNEIFERLARRKFDLSRNRVALFEPDGALRSILEFELDAAGFEVDSLPVNPSAVRDIGSAVLVAMFDERRRIEAAGPMTAKCVYLRGRSVASSLSAHSRPATDDLIGVVSAWDGFLSMAKVILLAVNIEPGNLIVRSSSSDGWEKSVEQANMLICDSLTASRLPNSAKLKVFRLISDESVDEIRKALQST